jgi:hypothetical protein
VLLPIQRIVLTDDVSINLSVDVAVMHETSYIYRWSHELFGGFSCIAVVCSSIRACVQPTGQQLMTEPSTVVQYGGGQEGGGPEGGGT